MVVRSCNASTLGMMGESQVQSHPWLHSEIEANLDTGDPILKGGGVGKMLRMLALTAALQRT